MLLGSREVTAPSQRLGQRELERREHVAGRCARQPAPRALFGGEQVVTLERLLGRAGQRSGGALRSAATQMMLGENERRWLAATLEPVCSQPMAEGAVGFGEHLVGRFADEVVAERELSIGPGGALAHDQNLGLEEGRERGIDLGGVGAQGP